MPDLCYIGQQMMLVPLLPPPLMITGCEAQQSLHLAMNPPPSLNSLQR